MKLSLMRASLALAALAIGCSQSEVPAPKTPTSNATVVSTTRTTSAQAKVPVSSNLNVSEEIREACHLDFANPSQAPKFDFDIYNLRQDDENVLAQIGKCLTTGPLAGRSVQLVGRADPRGELEYNFALGEHRATSVEEYLHALGVGHDKVTTTSRGKLDAMGKDAAGWQMDRRVDIDLK